MSDKNIITRPGRISRWGNSGAVRLAAAALERAHIAIDDEIDVIATDNEIVIRRRAPRVTLAELLARFDPTKHRHDLQLDVEPTGTETL